MQKAHDSSMNNYWRDKPNETTPIVAQKKNQLEVAVDTIDNRVISLDLTKANQADLLGTINGVTFNESNGVFTFIKANGQTIEIDTALEKVVTNFDIDTDPSSPHYQQMILTLEDGTVKYVDLSAFLTQYEFINSSTIRWTINASGEVTANIIDGSVTANKLQPNYLADITTQANAAAQSATASANSAVLSQSWAVGDTGAREDEDTQNSKYFADRAAETVAELLAAFGISVVGTRLVFGATFEEQYDVEVVGTQLIISERS